MKGWGLASAVRTLTILPFPGNESDSPATTLYWFVPVGALLGFILYGVALLCQPLQAPFLTGSLLIGLLALLTRAFHLDGLCDMFDGFGGGWTKERKLEIMKGSTVGAFGVIALIITLLVKVSAVALMIERGGIPLLVYVPILSRLFVVAQSVFNPYARKEGGTAARLVTEGRVRHVAISVVWVVVVIILYKNVVLLRLGLLVGVAATVTVGIALHARKQIGGVTGDILGATVELSEAGMLLAAAIVMPLPL